MQTADFVFSLRTAIGLLTLQETAGRIVALDMGPLPPGADPAGSAPTPLLAEAARQLLAWLDGRLQDFDVPLAPTGTAFQQRVWAALATIPYGATRTYGALAQTLGSGPRAVGGACGRNPVPILIPCHRVVGAGGRAGGYSAHDGIATKAALLALEKRNHPTGPEPGAS